MDLSPDEQAKFDALREKYAHTGQDLPSYLEGLLHSRYLTYWEYIQVDTLLSLQKPRTDFPDEVIFIGYHQITELYFKLIQHELNQLASRGLRADAESLKRLKRVIAYFKHLSQSFEVMVEGMEPEQFLAFRMALLPASGFQSAQFREIEFKLTSLDRLLEDVTRTEFEGKSTEEHYEHIYWKRGNRELATGAKTLTLEMFEEEYDEGFRRLEGSWRHKNLRAQFLALPSEQQADDKLRQALRQLDIWANVFWRLSHYKSAVRYLQKDPEDIKATGGTNWQQYLPPRFQRIIFYPELWSAQEQAEWGKTWVVSLFKEQVEDAWAVV